MYLEEFVRWARRTLDGAVAFGPGTSEMKRMIAQGRIALIEAEHAIAQNAEDGTAWRMRGDALLTLKRLKDAIVSYNRALAIEPEAFSVWTNLVTAIKATGQLCRVAPVPLDLENAESWILQAGDRFRSKRYAEAILATDRALALDAQNVAAARIGIHSRMLACDWDRWEEDKRRVSDGLRAGSRVVSPLYHICFSDSESQNLTIAQLWSNLPSKPAEPLWRGEAYKHTKIRIAYLSSDFFNNVVASVVVGCFERHDKSRFEITAISLGRDDGSELRRRIVAACDRFIDARNVAEPEVAKLMREMEIDIAIDLQGHTRENHVLQIFSHRPVPVRVNYLGYPGTVGAPFVDYVIADRIVIPEKNQIHYSEKVVYLPHFYLPNDYQHLLVGKKPSRAEEGLPEKGFIFACFNLAVKIRPEVFATWMRLLNALEGSVLWLRSTSPASMVNLRREAMRRGIDPDRIIFASWKPDHVHLARQTIADLFLDTLPYNAHSTATEALWVGLPVLTCIGNTFPGRVAASLLYAVGCPELVTSSLTEYENVARRLSENPRQLADIRSKLIQLRHTSPVFDTASFTRNLEAAFIMMWNRSERGGSPESFSIIE